MALTAYDTAILTLNPIVHMRFDEPSGTPINYGTSGTPVVRGSPTLGVTGLYTSDEMVNETGIAFNGVDQSIDLGLVTNGGVGLVGGISVLALVKFTLKAWGSAPNVYNALCGGYNTAGGAPATNNINGWDIRFGMNTGYVGAQTNGPDDVCASVFDAGQVQRASSWLIPGQPHQSGTIQRLVYFYLEKASNFEMGMDDYDIPASMRTNVSNSLGTLSANTRIAIGAINAGGSSWVNHGQFTCGRFSIVPGPIPLATRRALLNMQFKTVGGIRRGCAMWDLRNTAKLWTDSVGGTNPTLTDALAVAAASDQIGSAHLSQSTGAYKPKLFVRNGKLLGLAFDATISGRASAFAIAAGGKVTPAACGFAGIDRFINCTPLVGGAGLAELIQYADAGGGNNLAPSVFYINDTGHGNPVTAYGDTISLGRNSYAATYYPPEGTFAPVRCAPGRPSVWTASVGTDGTAYSSLRTYFSCDGTRATGGTISSTGAGGEKVGKWIGGNPGENYHLSCIMSLRIVKPGPIFDDEIAAFEAWAAAREEMAAPAAARVFLLGDSVSSGVLATDMKNWQNSMSDTLWNTVEFYNMSIIGATYDNLGAAKPSLSRRIYLSSGELATAKWMFGPVPQKVIFMAACGVNDFGDGQSGATTESYLKTLREDCLSMAPGASFLVQLPNSHLDVNAGGSGTAYAAALESAIRARSPAYGLVDVDLPTSIAGAAGYSFVGDPHYNNTGMALAGAAWWRQGLEPLLGGSGSRARYARTAGLGVSEDRMERIVR